MPTDSSALEVVTTAVGAATGVPVLGLSRLVFRPFLTRLSEERSQRALAALVDAWVGAFNTSPEQAAAEVKKLLTEGSPRTDDDLHRAFRTMHEAMTDAAWPYVAMLTALHIKGGVFDRAFFLRCGDYLRRCDRGDLEVVHSAAVKTLEVIERGSFDAGIKQVMWGVAQQDDGHKGIRVEVVAPAGDRSEVSNEHAGRFTHAQCGDALALFDTVRLSRRRFSGATFFEPDVAMPLAKIFCHPLR